MFENNSDISDTMVIYKFRNFNFRLKKNLLKNP
mgnify:CR=1 FL=1